jgi:hypothetical protein
MNYGLVIRALEKHVRMAQAAVNFAREKRRGQLFAEAMYVLDEAQRALDHVKEEQKCRPTSPPTSPSKK